MSVFTKIVTVLAKAALDRILTRERTEELVAVLSEWRNAPAQADLTAASATTATASLGNVTPEQKTEVTTLLNASAPQVVAILSDYALPPEAAAARLLEQFPKSGKYILWLDAPPLKGRPCYVLFNWDNRGEGQAHAFTVRDFINGRLYHGHHARAATREPLMPQVEEWNDKTAADMWAMGRSRQKCTGGRDGTDFPVKDGDRWKQLLEDLTRTKAP